MSTTALDRPRTGRHELHVRVVTPTGAITEKKADAVTAPGEQGEFEVLPGHIPFLTAVHAGVLILGEKSTRDVYAVGPGYVQVGSQGDIEILVDQAIAAADIDPESARSELQDAAEALKGLHELNTATYKSAKAKTRLGPRKTIRSHVRRGPNPTCPHIVACHSLELF